MVRLLACRALPTPISTHLLSFSRRMITWSNGGNAMVVEWTRKSESASPFLARFRVARPFYPRPSSQLKVHRIYFKYIYFLLSTSSQTRGDHRSHSISQLSSFPRQAFSLRFEARFPAVSHSIFIWYLLIDSIRVSGERKRLVSFTSGLSTLRKSTV